MGLSRRKMLKNSFLSIIGLPLILKGLGLANIAKSEEARKDAAVKNMGYIHDVIAASDPKHDDHKNLLKINNYSKNKTAKFTPKCDNCKYYKQPEGDWGTCTMVGARGASNKKYVYKNGICKVYAKNS